MQIRGLSQILESFTTSTPRTDSAVHIKDIHEIDTNQSRRMRHNKNDGDSQHHKPMSKHNRIRQNRDKRHMQDRGHSHMFGDQRRAAASSL
mmetsp:Transcript_4275/g.4893  ORF Transcript_4275/g.4893 Transcript_4275/m.4893 type:complete len:91 (+) Transcript_4275:85-357(+)